MCGLCVQFGPVLVLGKNKGALDGVEGGQDCDDVLWCVLLLEEVNQR